ncbi:hypothetical protein [Streptosporangium sp. NPDC002524]|uniref:hypothetical protein n=1 Tax=Streptosporangium sp. NPDC002524 TaxID=3154537 RepID=UPI00331AF50C
MYRRVRNALIATFLIITTTAVASEAASDAAPGAGAHSAEELFRGVLFKEGDVARLVYGADRSTAGSRATGDKVVASLDSTSSGLLARFATEITSGDRTRIAGTLVEAGDRMRTSIEQSGGGAAASTAGSFVVTEGLIIYTDSGTYWTPSQNSGRLEEERLIDRIAEELKR